MGHELPMFNLGTRATGVLLKPFRSMVQRQAQFPEKKALTLHREQVRLV